MNVRVDNGRLRLEGRVTSRTAADLLEQGLAQVRTGVEVVDFGAVEEIDSSAVAMTLQWLREARACQGNLRFVNLPPAFVNLARLYGVDDLYAAHTAHTASD